MGIELVTKGLTPCISITNLSNAQEESPKSPENIRTIPIPNRALTKVSERLLTILLFIYMIGRMRLSLRPLRV